MIAKTEPELCGGHLLKEGMRYVFAVKGDEAKKRSTGDLVARRSRIEAFVLLQRRIVRYRLRSKPLSTPDSRTPSSNRPTPKSGSSHVSPTASTNPKRSSLSLFSPLVDTAPNSHDDTHDMSEEPDFGIPMYSRAQAGSLRDFGIPRRIPAPKQG